MKAGADIVIDEPLDSTFAENLTTIQDIYATWYDDAERIAVRGPTVAPPPAPNPKYTATFFSGGVDSFYTLLKHKEEIDALVYVHGFDVKLSDSKLRAQVSDMLHRVGEAFGKEVIEVETNLRDFSDFHVDWGQYHGAGLATVALSLQDRVDHIHIASSLPYNNLKPWGSSPVLDPLWSTGKLEIIHDGCEADRLAKCEVVSQSETALSHLRVCWENRNNAYNCGRCEKCLRSMVQLLATDGLDRCTRFEQPLDPARLRRLHEVREKSYHYGPARDALDEKRIAPDVVQAIDAALQEPSILQRMYQQVYKQARWVYHRVRARLSN